MNKLIDQPDRERFFSELDRNFSVVAAAGSGKTRAITDRIVQIAKSENSRDRLLQLVVVAFTNRAADEMQQRARAEVLQAGVSLEVLAAFNRTFFGTIHSFCVRLLETYGHYLGLPPTFEVITDDDEIWNDFVQQRTTIGRSLSDENRRALLRHVQVRSLMELGRHADLNVIDPPTGKCPDTDFSAIHRYVAKGATLQTLPPYQKELKRVEQIWRGTEDFVRWPICSSKAKDFVRIKREAFATFRRWIDQAALCVATEVQRDYRAFRIERGLLTYDDQIALALELTKHPKIGREIREKSFRVILDEAQDTDPRQFSLLLELARPPEAAGEWLETRRDHPPSPGYSVAGPRPGHFCMVGDFQQSIYRDRADLARYRRIHDTLVETGAAEALKFSVTFRLDTAQLGFVNETFREILNDCDHQVAFVELNPRPEILPGQVVRLNLQPGNLLPDSRGKISDTRKAAEEACQLGQWLHRTGPEKLRAETWRDVAILCPRKEWLQTLRRGLRAAGLNVQIQSEKELKGDSPAYAWLTALLIIMAQPRCGYEIAGLLRELFGISDHDLALFSEGYGDRFQIETLTSGSDIVSKKLSLLAQIRLSILPLPLLDAINEIVRETRLRERLNALPREDFENLDGELDALLALAGSSEAEAMTLTEFSELLRTHFADVREIRPSRPDAIQLITSQKAKGSEWQAVIVPFLTRKVHSASPRYPRLIKNRETGETTVLLDFSDVTDEIDEELKREERQEMERLLYVALTRARHTLVLAFDNELFAKASGEGLPVEEIAAVEERWKPNDLLRLPRPASPALRYGLWWHDFVQRLPWSNGSDGWDDLFQAHRKLSPDPARSLREWKLLLNHLSGTDDFRKFAGDELTTHSELPFLWRLDQGRCLEGVVDLALFNSAARKCLILDWKTDRVPPDSTETLHARYRPQLAAYWKAVREMTQMGVEAAIYSTSTGAFLLYKEEELTQEWTRLKGLPPEQLFSEMAGDQAETPVQLEFFELSNRARRG